MSRLVSLEEIKAAQQRIKPHIHRTPVLTCSTIDRMAGVEIFFKCENFQKAGAFKIRGATNAIFSLTEDQAAKGVATVSSGNHGQALALAASWRGIKAKVVMPENAPAVKKVAVAGYGAEIVYCSKDPADRNRVLARVLEESGAHLVHPYDDERIIAGQGTACLELLDQAEELDLILAPVGGGGLISGTAVTARALSPKTKVIAVEPAGADDAYRSLIEGQPLPSLKPETIADGLRSSLSQLTFDHIRELVERIVLVSEADLIAAMRLVWERMKIIIEPSSAVPLAGLLSGAVQAKGQRVGIIISGGNVDLGALPW